MAAQKVVVDGSTVSARQMKDFWRQVDDGSITGEILQAVLEHRNPFEKVINNAMFTVTSDGRTGEEFIRDFKRNDYRVGDYASDVMRKPAFVATNDKTYRLGLIKGEEFSDAERSTKNICAEAARRGWLTPPAEVAPLLRETVSDEEIKHLGLWWLVVMHEPIIDSDGGARLLGLHRHGGGQWLDTRYGKPGRRWGREDGFLFLLPQD